MQLRLVGHRLWVKQNLMKDFLFIFYQGIIIGITQLFYKQHFNIHKHSTKQSKLTSVKFK